MIICIILITVSGNTVAVALDMNAALATFISAAVHGYFLHFFLWNLYSDATTNITVLSNFVIKCIILIIISGNTVAVVLDMNAALAIVISAAVAIFYTFLGGLYSVAYTDVIQFFCIAGGLVRSKLLLFIYTTKG